jgi:choline dehydrogenase-like flavoprotein
MQRKIDSPTKPDDSRQAAVAIARALLPSNDQMEGAGLRTVLHAESFISRVVPEALPAWKKAHVVLSQAARLATGSPLHELSNERAEELVQRWSDMPLLRSMLFGLASIYKVAHFDLPDLKGALREPLRVIQAPETFRWESQIVRGEDLDEEEITCDVVVVGTGAGGAVVGRHLADRGHAVVFLEEGEHIRRHEFPGNFQATVEQIYRNVFSLGNQMMMISQGRLVGGSTAVNTGTSFRPPRWVMDRWCEEFGSDDFRPDALDPYYSRVETILQVEPADVRYAGPPHEIFHRGAQKLGWHADTIKRNAPGCRGEGMCDNGCPTDARRSTLIAYLPGALERGNMVFSGVRAERVLMSGGRAIGIEGVALDRKGKPVRGKSGADKRIVVKAATVIMAGGAMATPQFLLKQRLGNSSDQLGRNLTLHPSGPTVGLFDEVVDGHKYIPQTAYSHEFLKEGIMLLSAQADANMMPPTTPLLGRRLMQVFKQPRHLACAGFLLADSARGRIRLGPGGRTLLTYNLTRLDVERMQRAQVRVTDLLLAAGAREVYPGILPGMTIFDRAGVDRLATRKLAAGDFMLTSYHPLGTARMSPSAAHGVVDLDHAVHDVPGLFVVDSSTVSGPLGVNPQLTVMALATRASDRIAQRID